VTTLLVASTGGHLKELHHLHGRLAGIEGPYRWATFDTPQSRSLLAGEAVEFVPFVGGRDPLNVARNFPRAHDALRGGEVEAVISTGSAVALPFFGLARARRIRCLYIESAARIDAPSLTGRLISRVPGVNRYSQYPGWKRRGWSFGGSVFDSFVPGPDRQPPGGALGKVVVTLGTYRGYPFTRLIRRLLEVLPPEVEVLWQTGDTDVGGLGIAGHRAIPEHELSAAMREADVVVAHAGVGTALAAFEVGKRPLLVPRRFALGEHVDDHQSQIAGELGERGLSVSVDADELGLDDLLAAAAGSVTSPAQAPAFATSTELSGAGPSSRSENSL
jgi:UDP-N-acetylglucosamine--N-acetylmuramyl-(pentapeptide) pyrophosphoryl-undecaprenol N-acetylglucosamine transferase